MSVSVSVGVKVSVGIIWALSLLISCKSEIKEIPVSNQFSNKKSSVKTDTFSFDASAIQLNLNLKSELRSRLENLKDLENNYQIEKFEKSSLEESIVYNGIEMLPEFSNKRIFYNITNFDKFEENIEEINQAYIKGTKDIGGSLYPRAKIEEVIFKSEDIANRLVKFKKKINVWEDIDKSPNSIFQKKNKVYYISSGGFYMQSFYQEIETKMKE